MMKFEIDQIRKEMMISKLKPIKNWQEMKEGDLMFHEQSNEIDMADTFKSVDFKTKMMKYINCEGEEHHRSLAGWYMYDYDILKEVKKEKHMNNYYKKYNELLNEIKEINIQIKNHNSEIEQLNSTIKEKEKEFKMECDEIFNDLLEENKDVLVRLKNL